VARYTKGSVSVVVCEEAVRACINARSAKFAVIFDAYIASIGPNEARNCSDGLISSKSSVSAAIRASTVFVIDSESLLEREA
jgi:hypothetical protein